jgi:hypothetical protein
MTDNPANWFKITLSAVVPAHSASLRAFTPVFDGLWTRVNALVLGTHIPEAVVMGPRFRGDDRIRNREWDSV